MVVNIVDVGWATSKSGCLPISDRQIQYSSLCDSNGSIGLIGAAHWGQISFVWNDVAYVYWSGDCFRWGLVPCLLTRENVPRYLFPQKYKHNCLCLFGSLHRIKKIKRGTQRSSVVLPISWVCCMTLTDKANTNTMKSFFQEKSQSFVFCFSVCLYSSSKEVKLEIFDERKLFAMSI